MNFPSIVVIGNNTIDNVYVTHGVPGPDQKLNAISVKQYAGGQAANVAHCLAAFGLPVHFLGSFGDDEAGTASKASLLDCGISLEGELTVSQCPTHVATVIVDHESHRRSIVMYKDDRLRLRNSFVKPEWVQRASLVYFDNHEPEAALAAAKVASAREIPVLADLEVLGPRVAEMLSHISSLIAPAEILGEMTGEEDVEKALRWTQRTGPSTVVATMGSAGAIGISGDHAPVSVPAAPCNVVDTTGAGDAFHAGYIAGVCAGMGFPEALKFASHTAAAKCEENGPRVGFARARELRAMFLGNASWRIPRRHHLI